MVEEGAEPVSGGVDHPNAQKYFIHLGTELLAHGDNKKHSGQVSLLFVNSPQSIYPRLAFRVHHSKRPSPTLTEY